MTTTEHRSIRVDVDNPPKWGTDADGVPSLWAIFPNRSDRAEYVRSMRGRYNYILEWDDVHGAGLELTWYRPDVARWLFTAMTGRGIRYIGWGANRRPVAR